LYKSIDLFYFVIQSTFIMSDKDYLKDISEIKNLMTKSSRFISLSGLSGILAGVYALIGAAFAFWLVTTYSNSELYLDGWVFRTCLLILAIVAALSILTGIYLTTRKAKKNGEKIWDASSKQLILNFLIPLITGGHRRHSLFRLYRNCSRINMRLISRLWILALGYWFWDYAYYLWNCNAL